MCEAIGAAGVFLISFSACLHNRLYEEYDSPSGHGHRIKAFRWSRWSPAADNIFLNGKVAPKLGHERTLATTVYYLANLDTNYHFGFLSAFFFAKVPRPLAPLVFCSSVNFFFAYLFASASSTSSSTSVRLRCERARLSPLAVPKGVFEGTMVPIYRFRKHQR